MVGEKLTTRDLNKDSFINAAFEGMELDSDRDTSAEESTIRTAQIELTMQTEINSDTISTMGTGTHFGNPMIRCDSDTIIVQTNQSLATEVIRQSFH